MPISSEESINSLKLLIVFGGSINKEDTMPPE